MTDLTPGTNSAENIKPTNTYDGLPKPPMAPPSKATEKIPLIFTQKVGLPADMGKYLEKKGVSLEMLQFDTCRLLIGSVRGGRPKQPNENFEGNLFFQLRGIRLDDNILLRVEWAPEGGEIQKGHIFHDINEAWELISNSDRIVRYPILSFRIEPIEQH